MLFRFLQRYPSITQQGSKKTPSCRTIEVEVHMGDTHG